jgi:hypothetical protein
MDISEKAKNAVIGKEVVFEYDGNRYVRKVVDLYSIGENYWYGDLGFKDEDDYESDSFMVCGDSDENGFPLMKGLIIKITGKRSFCVRAIIDVSEKLNLILFAAKEGLFKDDFKNIGNITYTKFDNKTLRFVTNYHRLDSIDPISVPAVVRLHNGAHKVTCRLTDLTEDSIERIYNTIDFEKVFNHDK